MIVWIRNIIVIFLILSVVYVLLSYRSRRRNQDRLNADYVETQTQIDKTEFMAKGMERYNRSLRAKLILGVYILPFLIGCFLWYLAQYG